DMPGMNMLQQKPATTAAPKKMETNMPGMQMPMPQTTPAPSSSPQQPMQMNMPGMQMPSSSPNPQASPQQKMQMSMPMPSASPGASPPQTTMPGMNMPMPGASPSPGMQNMKDMKNMSGMGEMNLESLMVMRGDDMAVRIGDSETNVMNLGQMGSGTSWQPDTSPTYMMDKMAGRWLLMFHYNAIVGVNAQGGPRGATKFESANWF